MPTALGARVALAQAFETTYGTAPATGYRRLSFTRANYGAEQPLIESNQLGLGRDPAAPMQGFVDVSLELQVPVDLVQIGWWLRMALGAPTTTSAAGVFTHVFESGSFSLPSAAIEIQNPEVPAFAMHAGVMLDSFGWDFARKNEPLDASLSFLARSEVTSAATAAGTPTTPGSIRLGHFNGSIQRNGSSLGDIVEGSFRYANNLKRIETVQASGLIEGIDPGMASLAGQLNARFSDLTLLNQAASGGPCELTLRWQRSASESLTIVAHAVYIDRPRRQIQGPDAVMQEFSWQAARAATPARMMTVTLVNAQSSYS